MVNEIVKNFLYFICLLAVMIGAWIIFRYVTTRKTKPLVQKDGGDGLASQPKYADGSGKVETSDKVASETQEVSMSDDGSADKTENLSATSPIQEKCLCGEGIMQGKVLDANCPIHKNSEEKKE